MKDYFVFDFETTNHRKGSPFDSGNQPVCVAWVIYTNQALHQNTPSPEREIGFHHFHADWLKQPRIGISSIVADLVEPDFCDPMFVGHNIKFDLHWWDRLGYPRGDNLWDTMFPPYVENPRQGKSLSSLVEHGKLESGSIWVHDLGLNPLDMDPRECVRYCLQDVLATESLFLSQYAKYGGN